MLSLVVEAAALALLERTRPRRARLPGASSATPRAAKNAAVIATAAVASAIEGVITDVVARRVRRRRLPLAVKLALLDYTLYLWHVATHKVPFLWRFHRVHHLDRELTLATAFRFHGGELLLSIPYRIAQIVLLGVTPRELALFRRLLMMSVMFHHSNVRLPARFERLLSLLVATPALHEIHHSQRPEETASNWSSGLTIWDALHGTLRTVAREPIRIGVADEPDPGPQRLVLQPFTS